MPRFFQLLDEAWPSTVHSLDDDDAAGGSIKGKKGRCWSQPVVLTRADWFLIGILVALAVLYATAPLRFADSQYFSSTVEPTAAARAWLTAETDARFGLAGNASLSGGVAEQGAHASNQSSLLLAMEAAAYSTVVAEVGIFAASLAGGCSVLLALMHAALAWGALAPPARGRIIVFAVAVGLLLVRSFFLSNETRTLMRRPFSLGTCTLSSTNSHQLYVFSIVAYVFLCVCLLYKTVRGEIEKRKRIAAAQALAARGGVDVSSHSDGGALREASETPDLGLQPGSDGQHDFPQAAMRSEDSDHLQGGPDGVLAADMDGVDATPEVDDGPSTTQAALPLLPPRHFYLPALGGFFVLELLAIHPFLGEAWAVTAGSWLGIVSLAFLLLGVFAAYATIRYEVNGPVCSLLCAALGFTGPRGLGSAWVCCVGMFNSCCNTRSRLQRPIVLSARSSMASSSADDSLDEPREHRLAKRRCCARSSPHCCVNLMHLVVFPLALICPNILEYTPDVECPAWLAAGGGGLAGSPGSGPPPGSKWPAGLNASSANDRTIVTGSLVFMLAQVAAASVLAVFVSGAVILDGQSELAARRRDAASEAAETLRRAIGYISHEARGPLNAAVLSLALLEDVDEEEQELAAAGHHAPPADPIGGDELSSERLLGDLATSINASKRHLDDLLLWERAGADGDVGGQARWVWTRPREGWLEAVERAFRSTCEAEGMTFDVKPLVMVASEAGRAARFVPGSSGTVSRLRRTTTGQDSTENVSATVADGAATDMREGGAGARRTSGSGAWEMSRLGADGSSSMLAVEAPEGLEVFVDADRILGVFTNAVSNCIKHTPGEGRGLVSACCTVILGRAASSLAFQPPAQSPPGIVSRGGGSRWRSLCLATSSVAAPAARADRRTRVRSAASRAPARAAQAGAGAMQALASTPTTATAAAVTAASAFAPGNDASSARVGLVSESDGASGADAMGDEFTFPPERGVLQIEVRDNGRGISKDLLESGKLFQPFARLRQGDDSLRMTSSGLGLAIVRSIVVEGMKGRVGLSSEEGQGTTFFARVPVWVRARRRDAQAADTTPSDTTASAVDMPDAGAAPSAGRQAEGPSPPPAHQASVRPERAGRNRPKATEPPPAKRRPVKSSRVVPCPSDGEEASAGMEDPRAASFGCAASDQSFGGGGLARQHDLGRERLRSAAGEGSELDPPLTVITTSGHPSHPTATRRGRSQHRLTSVSPRGRANKRATSAASSPFDPRTSASQSSTNTGKDKAARAARRKQRQQERDDRRRARSDTGRAADGAQGHEALPPFVGEAGRDDRQASQQRLAKRRLSQRLAASTRGLQAFVVDDERVNRTLLAALLRRWGFGATEFEHGGAVVEALREIVEAQVAAALPPSAAAGHAVTAGGAMRKSASVGVAAGAVGTPPSLGAALGATVSARSPPTGGVPSRLGLGVRARAVPQLPAMVTLDVEMPVLSGFGVLKKRQQMARDLAKRGYRDIAVALLAMPVVVVSGNARQADKDVLTTLGAKAVLTKPVEPEQLARLVAQFSGHAQT